MEANGKSTEEVVSTYRSRFPASESISIIATSNRLAVAGEGRHESRAAHGGG